MRSRKAQRQLVFACYTDWQGPERERRLKEINGAADELIDRTRRGVLDASIAAERARRQAAMAPPPAPAPRHRPGASHGPREDHPRVTRPDAFEPSVRADHEIGQRAVRVAVEQLVPLERDASAAHVRE